MNQAAIAHPSEVINRVLAYPVPNDVIEKYADKYALTEVVAHEHERELKRYLAMCLAQPDAEYGMFGPIDEFWHTWVLFTREWWEFSQSVAGHYIHHRPTTRKEKELVLSGVIPSGYARFLADYAAFFGEEPPAELWPRALEAMAGADCTCSTCTGGCSHNECAGGG